MQNHGHLNLGIDNPRELHRLFMHCGAFVNHIHHYSRLRMENSLSTLELIKLSMRRIHKKLSFISTASAITWQCDKLALNLTNPVEISLVDYLNVIEKVTGKKITIIPFNEWKEKLTNGKKKS